MVQVRKGFAEAVVSTHHKKDVLNTIEQAYKTLESITFHQSSHSSIVKRKETLKKVTRRAQMQVSNVFDWISIQTGQFKPNISAFNLGTMAREVI